MPDRSAGSDHAEQRLTAMFTAHHRQVEAYVARRTRPLGDHAVAQVVAAEVFTLAWRRLSDPAPTNGPPAISLPWLLATAGNVLSQWTRDDARRSAREERAMTDRAMAPRSSRANTDPADALALSEQVARALDRMAPADRELLLLRVWDELSFAEAAQVLGCSPGAARVRWLRARRRFAAELTREEHDSDPAPGSTDPAEAIPRPAATNPGLPMLADEARTPTTQDAPISPCERPVSPKGEPR